LAADLQAIDTIAALATAPGKSALAVIRISGPAARGALVALGVRPGKPRQARLRYIRNASGEILDRGLVLWFPGPASHTGEDCAELQVHGGRYVTDAVLEALCAAGVRLAVPGEFTRRAFENGKIDLGQAEAIADLIDAETAAQADQAIQQLQGALGARYQAWRETLIDILARLEVLVDFPEDETGDALEGVASSLELLSAELRAAVADGVRGRQVRDGYRVAIVGPPNAGKSTLFNRLVGREAAIVADLAGTTRDIIEAAIELSGYRVLLADTAGLHASDQFVEQEGIRRALVWANDADRRIWVIDGAARGAGWREGMAAWRAGDLYLLNKADLKATSDADEARVTAQRLGLVVMSDTARDQGADLVRDWLDAEVREAMSGRDFPAVTRLRHAMALKEALDALTRAIDGLISPELASEDVRLAVRALASVTGLIATEEILGKVFSTFCIGK
jgi:tRNA modification GTPase